MQRPPTPSAPPASAAAVTRRARAGVLVVVAFAAATAAIAQPRPHPVMSDFQPSGQYLLVVDGATVEEARIFLSQRAAAFLVLADALPDPILLWGRSGRIDRVPTTALLERPDGGLDVADGTERTYLGDLRPEDGEIVLAFDGRNVRLRPRPPLVGSHDLDELLAHSPDYLAGLSTYTPDVAAIRRLAELASGVRVRIFFGSWCGVCKRFLPHALRVERELAGSAIRFQHYGLDNPPAGWEDAEVKANKITNLPTAIVYRGDEELGRLVGAEDFAEPERTLLDIVGGG